MIPEPKGFIYEIHQKMKEHNVLLAFTGEFDMKIINALVHSVKMKLIEVEGAAKVQKKVYNIMVECLESIFRTYEALFAKNPSASTFAIFTLGKATDYYYLISGNYMSNDSVESVKEHIDNVNNLTTDNKKKLFRTILSDHNLEKYDPFLALVDISIKSGNALEYDFKPINDQTSFYLFEVKIKTN